MNMQKCDTTAACNVQYFEKLLCWINNTSDQRNKYAACMGV